MDTTTVDMAMRVEDPDAIVFETAEHIGGSRPVSHITIPMNGRLRAVLSCTCGDPIIITFRRP